MGIDISDKITINHCVPQRAVLGPLIFLLHVNDFSKKLERENDVAQFADDTSIIFIKKTKTTIKGRVHHPASMDVGRKKGHDE